jgi:multicomponent Na+:H+ antiporter subunit F
MFELLIRFGILWSIALAATLAAAAARGRSTIARILWVDTLALTLVAAFALIGILRSSAQYLDAALALALLAFAGTLAAVAHERDARLL